MQLFPLSFMDILAARDRIVGQVLVTLFLEACVLSQISGARIFIKFEKPQFTGSFKERGALNRLPSLAPEESARGVAFHAPRSGIPALILMPKTPPLIKVEQPRARLPRARGLAA